MRNEDTLLGFLRSDGKAEFVDDVLIGQSVKPVADHAVAAENAGATGKSARSGACAGETRCRSKPLAAGLGYAVAALLVLPPEWPAAGDQGDRNEFLKDTDQFPE